LNTFFILILNKNFRILLYYFYYPEILFFFSFLSLRCASESAYNICKNDTTAVLRGRDILPNVATIDIGIAESFLALWCMILFIRGLFYIVLRYLN